MSRNTTRDPGIPLGDDANTAVFREVQPSSFCIRADCSGHLALWSTETQKTAKQTSGQDTITPHLGQRAQKSGHGYKLAFLVTLLLGVALPQCCLVILAPALSLSSIIVPHTLLGTGGPWLFLTFNIPYSFIHGSISYHTSKTYIDDLSNTQVTDIFDIWHSIVLLNLAQLYLTILEPSL